MIYLLQTPRPSGHNSGGYRYNSEIGARLVAAGLGRALDVPSERLAECLERLERHDREAIFVLDSLYILECSSEQRLAVFSRGGRKLLLMHWRASEDPHLSRAESRSRAERELAWLQSADGVITTSRPLASAIAAQCSEVPVGVAQPGVSACFHRPDFDRRAHARGCVVVHVGTVTPAKGQLEAVRALASLESQFDEPIRLQLIGDARDTEYRSRVEAAAGDGLQLEWCGTLEPEEVASRLRDADLFLSTSHFESFGMASVEAVACGTPVLAFRCGEVETWVRDGHNGSVIPPGDEKALAERLADLLKHPETLRALREAEPPAPLPTWEGTFLSLVEACRDGATSAPEVELFSQCDLPTEHGEFAVRVYSIVGGGEAIMLHKGTLDRGEAPFVRVHSECFTGEVLGSLKCDCDEQLSMALREIQRRERGAVIYLRQEGRGIGLGNKIRAYAEQQRGADTIQANELLGFPVDLRDFSIAAQILKLSGVHRIVMNTNNPGKVQQLEEAGVSVEDVLPSDSTPNPHNRGYLETKMQEMGHSGLERSLRALRQGGGPIGEGS